MILAAIILGRPIRSMASNTAYDAVCRHDFTRRLNRTLSSGFFSPLRMPLIRSIASVEQRRQGGQGQLLHASLPFAAALPEVGGGAVP